jgi:hypothetical protein
MKDSKKYGTEIQKFYRSLKRKNPKVKKIEYDDIIESLIHAAVLEHISESVTKAVFKRFDAHFVDFNDMRVSRPEEIIEMLGQDSEDTRKVSANIVRILGSIFRKYNNVNLDSLRKVGKRQSRLVLEKFDGISRFCVDYCMLTALQGHAVPLTEAMIKYLKDSGLVHPEAELDDIEGFLTRQISAANAYEFYALLRRETESKGPGAGVKKTTTKAKTAKKRTTKKSRKKK